MSWKYKVAIISVLGPLLLSGCASFGKRPTGGPDPLPVIPVDIQICFNQKVKLPPGTVYTEKQMLELIGAMVQNDLKKSSCGNRLIAFYNAQRK